MAEYLKAHQLLPLLELKDKESITKDDLFSLFSKRFVKGEDGKTIVQDALIPMNGLFNLMPGVYPGIKESTVTTAGRFIVNVILFYNVFKERLTIPYINEVLKGDTIVLDIMVEELMTKRATPEDFAKVQNALVFIGNMSEMSIPGMSPGMLAPNPKVMQMKKELLKTYENEIKNGDHIIFAEKVEKPLLAFAKEELKDDYAMALFDYGSKPSFENNYKNSCVVTGPAYDPMDGDFKISTNSLSEGLTPDNYQIYANSLIMGSYNRGVATQEGGTWTKRLFAAMQSTVAGKKDSDCGTTKYLSITLDKNNASDYHNQYMVQGKNLVMLEKSNQSEYIGKTVEFRSPMFCNSKHDICNKCLGELFELLGITSVGIVVTRVTSTLLNMALKSMHSSVIYTTTIDPFEYMFKKV